MIDAHLDVFDRLSVQEHREVWLLRGTHIGKGLANKKVTQTPVEIEKSNVRRDFEVFNRLQCQFKVICEQLGSRP